MTITALARKFELSRAALLCYLRIGLLKPSARLANGGRRYSAKDSHRLRQICLYRQTDLPLAGIRKLLDSPRQHLAAALERQLHELASPIEALRSRRQPEKVNILNRETWVKLLRASGFTGENLHQWRRGFQRLAPEHHGRFPESLCIPAAPLQAIRAWSKQL
jgi:DNA-binding transcriptional MerR regulator